MVDKNSIFGGMLTTQGAAKKTNCDALGIPWEPRYMLIGDANGTDPVPSPSQTKLVNQVYRAQLNQLRVSPTDDNILIAELVLPPDVGGWWIRELALEDKDGVFSAVANAAPSYKPLLAQGSGRNQVVRMHIITSGTANIQLKIDPSVVLATRQYVDDSIKTVLPKDKTPGEWTRVKTNDRGIVVSGDNPSTLAGMGITDSYTKTQIEAMIAQASALPVGATVAFPTGTAAPGFLELDGTVKSIALYPDLAAYLGTTFNKGDEGAGNFRLPESRGEFLRGWDHGRGVDSGRSVGSFQKATLVGIDAVGVDGNAKQSTTAAYQLLAGTPDYLAGIAAVGGDRVDKADYPNTGATIDPMDSAGVTFTNGAVAYQNGSLVGARPRNLAVMWCIKAWNAPINQGNIDIAALEQRVRNNEYGRLLRAIEFTANGTYIPLPEMKSVRVRMVGASGGSGGTQATSSTQIALSGGTGSGSYAEALLTAAQVGESQEVLIGAAGIAGAPGGNGGNGGTTSLGTLVSAPGSSGGTAGVAFPYANSFINSGTPGAAMPSGANLIARRGSNGTGPINAASGTLSGAGGDSEFGAGGQVAGLSSLGYPGTGPGAGSSGIATHISTAARSGVAGMPGKMLLEEYA